MEDLQDAVDMDTMFSNCFVLVVSEHLKAIQRLFASMLAHVYTKQTNSDKTFRKAQDSPETNVGFVKCQRKQSP